MSDTAIQARQLTKCFAGKQAIDGLDLAIPTDSVFGLLGVNGAGKTTLIRMIMGHLHPTAGELTVLGTDPRAHPEALRRRIAYVSENMELPGHMTPERAVAFNASAYAQWDASLADTLLRDFSLGGAGPFKSLSKGQKRKLCILLAICQNADLLVMDEPAAGLDVVARREFLDQVLDIACQPGRTVLLSSHLLSDLERVVDRLAIIQQGRMLLTGGLEDLKAGVRKIHLHTDLSEETLRETFDLLRFEQPEPTETVVVVTDFTEEKMARLATQYTQVQDAHVVSLNLEDIFVELVGRRPGPENAIQESQP